MVSTQRPWHTSRCSLHSEQHSWKIQSSAKFRENSSSNCTVFIC